MTRVLSQPVSPALTGAAPPPAKPKRKTTYRDFGDAVATRQLIFDNALEAASTLEPYRNARHTLELADVHYADDKEPTLAEQKEAILTGRSLGRRLRGTWRLLDNATGKVLDQRKQTVAQVPYFTGRGTIIHRGSEYTLANQLRLRPGVYTREKENGELEAHVNVTPGRGLSHRYFLDPAKSTFYARVGQAKLPLLPLLRALGARDRELREAWGPEILAANLQTDNPAALHKYYERFLKASDMDSEEPQKRARLAEVLAGMELDPEVTRRTLGSEHRGLDAGAILSATRKLLAVSRGEAEVDDRDHLAYQTLHGPEDLIAERLRRDYGGLRRRLFQRASWTGGLGGVPTNALNRQVEAALLHSGLGMTPEEVNPAELLDKQTRVTRMGEGGIPSMDAVPDESRAVQPSHMGYIDPIRTPESGRVGVDVQLARMARKGSDGRVYIPLKDPRTGAIEYKSPQDIADDAVTFPRELAAAGKKRAWAMLGGRLRRIKKRDVNWVLPHFEDAFSPLANLVPMKSASKGQRLAMGARFISQALPLEEPEAPLVRGGIPGKPGESFESHYGKYLGAKRADKPGRVLAAGAGSMRVRYGDGSEEDVELYHNWPFNRKTFLHQTPVLRPGDTFQAGDLLARSNYTDAKGAAALGRNFRVAYVPWGGKNYEDAVVISEAAARKLTSSHMYQHSLDVGEDHRMGTRNFLGLFPGKYDKQTLSTLDEHGVVQPGTRVEHGSPLILAARQNQPSANKVHRKGTRGFSDDSVTWEHHSPGIVTDVAKTDKGITVLVKASSPMQVGDKLSGRYGDKGVVADIVPDERMPHDRDGNPYEVLLSPTGIISRANPSQVIETALGKIAARTGQPYAVPDFEDIQDLVGYAEGELRKHGLSDLEDIYDPETGRKIPQILTGSRYLMKLHHQAESKGQGRGTGGYTSDEAPAKGGEHGSKRVSLMDSNALMSHGVTSVLNDAFTVRGQANPDMWLAFMQGRTPPEPRVPHVYRKFVNSLRGAGINVVSDGTGLQIMAMTDKDIEHLAGDREIRTGETVRFDKGLLPAAGGLFDPKLTGGHHGNRWSFIKLDEPVPNPVMEEPIRRLLGLTEKQLHEVLAGRRELVAGGLRGTGPETVHRALSEINLPRELAIARAQIHGGRKTARDQAVRKLGYLKSAQRLGIHPKDWMLTKVPVLPPMFRPVSVMQGTGQPLVADANYLYKELLDSRDALRDMRGRVDDVGEERLNLYRSLKAVTGLADPLHPKLVEKKVTGLLGHIFGPSPKFSFLQRRLLSRTTDLVGRAVVAPDPDLDMDHVGLPETRAWDLYKNFIVRRLHRRGLPLAEAARHAEDRTELARKEMLSEMEERPVFINRAPVLHRFGIMAFWPKLVKGDTLKVSPLIVKGFNMDFDGDAVQYHLPAGEAARREAAARMLPSKNLLSPADFKTPVHAPANEYVAGLDAATRPPAKNKRPHRFASKKEAVAAYLRGEIDIDTPLEFDE